MKLKLRLSIYHSIVVFCLILSGIYLERNNYVVMFMFVIIAIFVYIKIDNCTYIKEEDTYKNESYKII